VAPPQSHVCLPAWLFFDLFACAATEVVGIAAMGQSHVVGIRAADASLAGKPIDPAAMFTQLAPPIYLLGQRRPSG